MNKDKSGLFNDSNRVRVVSSGNKWAVVKIKAKRALKIHKFREQAYFHARQISENVIVHNKDGTVLFRVKYGHVGDPREEVWVTIPKKSGAKIATGRFIDTNKK